MQHILVDAQPFPFNAQPLKKKTKKKLYNELFGFYSKLIIGTDFALLLIKIKKWLKLCLKQVTNTGQHNRKDCLAKYEIGSWSTQSCDCDIKMEFLVLGCGTNFPTTVALYPTWGSLCYYLPVVWTLTLTRFSEGWGMLYPQNVTLGLQDNNISHQDILC